MDTKILQYVELLTTSYPILSGIKSDIVSAYHVMRNSYQKQGKLLLAGNGGSAADCEHIVGELMKSFKLARPVDEDFADRLRGVDKKRGEMLSKCLEKCLPAISLTAHEALSTAYLNDVGEIGVFAQQLFGYGNKDDVFLAISTSGNSANILNAAVVAKARGIAVIGLTGQSGGELASIADVSVKVPETETYRIQELHLPIYHCWCMMLEENFFGKGRII